ncbi:DUF6193 family natural product biosynthesis protein [Streptomyces sp. CC208A]|uniref:DUF6193 family natural product biosynthesis protein n=1 Tax=Streptomyces sp. CC208A TaxID=3044573 RepID=UPI0024A912B6|nr:DUF6193 family natural product biosynthesis protein [Streptomyces sp. CC208A]
MPTPPEPAALYPDIAEAGSLAAALRTVAAGALDDVPLTSPAADPLSGAHVESVLPHRRAMSITAWARERRWSVAAGEPLLGLALVEGATDDLAQVARAARAWHDGEPAEGVQAAAPFARPTGRSELTDPDPARLVDSEWRYLRTEAARLAYPWREPYRALVEAAYAEPALRALYPFTSHWALRFSAATRPHLDVVGPNLGLDSDGGYAVALLMTERGRTFGTACEAVAEAVRLLPDGTGAVRYGASPPGTAGKPVDTVEEG